MDEKQLRKQLVHGLEKEQAHVSLDNAVKGLTVEMVNEKIPGIPYTIWHLVEHIRRTQSDILEFIRDPEYESPPWPKGYWPKRTELASRQDWLKTLADFKKDREALTLLVQDPKADILAKIPHGTGQNILREILLVIDHTAYHTGVLVLMRRIQGSWD